VAIDGYSRSSTGVSKLDAADPRHDRTSRTFAIGVGGACPGFLRAAAWTI
jgi:hypothetical protein